MTNIYFMFFNIRQTDKIKIGNFDFFQVFDILIFNKLFMFFLLTKSNQADCFSSSIKIIE